jgi:hypothetical protein
VRVGRYLFLVVAGLVPWSQEKVLSSVDRQKLQQDTLYLWSGEKVKILSTTFQDIMADIYWLRTIQYYGRESAFSRDPQYDLLLPLTDITTTLDPRFEIGYRYGSIFLSEAPPHGAGNPAAGLALLEKGVARNPTSWRLRWEMGTLQFFALKDPKRAAATLLEAKKLPGAPFWLENVAAALLTLGGERQVARLIWERKYQEEAGALKENALLQLKRLGALDTIDALKSSVAAFEAAKRRKPRSLDELIATGLLRTIPRDSTGTPFAYDPTTGEISIARPSSLWAPRLGGL